jgi:serine/threonine protein kinase
MVKTLKQQAEDDLPGYELGITLGSGGFGEVVVGTNIVSGIKYAIKIIPATIDPEDRKMVGFQCSLCIHASCLAR